MRKIAIVILVLNFFNFTVWAKETQEDDSSALALLAMEETPEDQEMFDKLKTRRLMLDWHTYTGWATVGLMAASLISAPDGKATSTHKWLGISSGVTYVASAALAYLAPQVGEVKYAKNISIHKQLAWVHVPAMLLTTYSGIVAQKERKDGKELSTLADLHKAFAAVTTVSFAMAAITSMDWSLNFLPMNKRDVACIFTKRF